MSQINPPSEFALKTDERRRSLRYFERRCEGEGQSQEDKNFRETSNYSIHFDSIRSEQDSSSTLTDAMHEVVFQHIHDGEYYDLPTRIFFKGCPARSAKSVECTCWQVTVPERGQKRCLRLSRWLFSRIVRMFQDQGGTKEIIFTNLTTWFEVTQYNSKINADILRHWLGESFVEFEGRFTYQVKLHLFIHLIIHLCNDTDPSSN